MSSTKKFAALPVVSYLLCCLLGAMGWAQVSQTMNPERSLLSIRPRDRVVQPIDASQRFTLSGQHHPLARPEYDTGHVALDTRMERMVLVLKADPAQDAALEELIRAQQDPASPYYHRWLTPSQFGERFGISQHDLDQVVNWLKAQGLQVDAVPASRRALIFSGNTGQVERAFSTSIHRYAVRGEKHYANALDPQIPQAVTEVVGGVLALHDFRTAAQHVAPAYTAGNGAHFLMPQDWATIYDVLPLYNQGIDGTGATIAVLGRVDIALSDIRTFRANAGLPVNDPQIIINGADPGFPWCDDELESAMDVEWAGAIAKNATVKFVTSKSGTSDGIALSAQYAVNNNVAPIVSLSYGLCESALGTAGNAFWNNTWMQAASQGMTVFVSSGDTGAAGCDSGSATKATQGRAVNGLCSSPYSTCVGGTQFNDGYNPSQYWSSSNGSGQSSALGYIPESAWNESAWSGGLWAGSGGASIVYSKPSWQSAPGVPSDGKRDVPDVSMHGSISDAYVVQIQGSTFYASGTSAAAPSLASVMAMVVENNGAQGNANPVFYALANQQLSAAGNAAFHDVTSGNNSVPGVSGFNAGTGYDEATGLGSVDGSVLVNNWRNASSLNFSLNANVSSVTVGQGSSATATLTLIGQGGFNSPVTLSATNVPAGLTVKFSSATLNQSSPVTTTISAASNATVGSSTITLSATGGGLTRTTTVAVVVVAPSFSLGVNVITGTVTAGNSTAVAVTTSPMNGFKSAVTLSASGLPAGITATFAPASIASPGSGTSTLTLKAAATASGGITNIAVKASGGGATQTQVVSLTVVVPTLSLTADSASATVKAGSTGSFILNTTAVNGFKSAVSLAVSGLPSGVTAKFAPSSIASPGTGSSTLTLTTAATTVGGVYPLTLIASGGGLSKTQALSLTVVGPTFTLALSGTSVKLARGGSIPLSVSTTPVNGFKAAISLTVSALPKGVTATFSPASIASPGSGSSTLTLKATSTATVGSSTVTVTASGGGAKITQSFSLTVQ